MAGSLASVSATHTRLRPVSALVSASPPPLLVLLLVVPLVPLEPLVLVVVLLVPLVPVLLSLLVLPVHRGRVVFATTRMPNLAKRARRCVTSELSRFTLHLDSWLEMRNSLRSRSASDRSPPYTSV